MYNVGYIARCTREYGDAPEPRECDGMSEMGVDLGADFEGEGEEGWFWD